ncbi:hypothetical protein [Thiococcus pfennigii]|uniref:hypothetical protein n=1 Tax=Thiococcus pfennigii TaxID=1057 RepID=UPI001905F755|nr:hypothetical protein [Thiococcus pfennigii]MBK1701379.1 hypothetical protein [Thiococcus pfennigii]
MRRVVVFDTSVLCVWLEVPGRETCGPADDFWDRERVQALIIEETDQRSTFVLPLATIIETGNHVAQAGKRRLETARALMVLLGRALDEEEPWAAFSQQADLWGDENLRRLVQEWPQLAQSALSLGDATISRVADFYARTGAEVMIATGDQGLKAYQPAAPVRQPRRRRR